MEQLLSGYLDLLGRVDAWFGRSMAAFPDQIRCGAGCSGCCRGLFDVTLLDGLLLARGVASLEPDVRERVHAAARKRIDSLVRIWPEWQPPYLLNHRPEEDWEELMPDGDESPCVLLGGDGRCLVYTYRPMTCRLHGLPLVDQAGDVLHDEWCTENFPAVDPLAREELREDFDGLFAEELALFRDVTEELLGERVSELDLFIPAAVLLENGFDWGRWWPGFRPRIVVNPLFEEVES